MIFEHATLNNPKEIVDSFAKYFFSVYAVGHTPDTDYFKNNINNSNYFWPCIVIQSIVESEVLDATRKLKPTSSNFNFSC